MDDIVHTVDSNGTKNKKTPQPDSPLRYDSGRCKPSPSLRIYSLGELNRTNFGAIKLFLSSRKELTPLPQRPPCQAFRHSWPPCLRRRRPHHGGRSGRHARIQIAYLVRDSFGAEAGAPIFGKGTTIVAEVLVYTPTQVFLDALRVVNRAYPRLTLASISL